MTSIPTDINKVYEELKTEVTWLHGRWIIYRQLDHDLESCRKCRSILKSKKVDLHQIHSDLKDMAGMGVPRIFYESGTHEKTHEIKKHLVEVS